MGEISFTRLMTTASRAVAESKSVATGLRTVEECPEMARLNVRKKLAVSPQAKNNWAAPLPLGIDRIPARSVAEGHDALGFV